MHWNIVLKKILASVVSVLLMPFKYSVKRKNVIILQASNRQIYCDNTRYLYEFLSDNPAVQVYWVTDNLEIKRYILSKGWKYITWHNPFKMVWVALRVSVVVDNGGGYFDIFNITNSKSVVKICLLHGSGPKATLSRSCDITETVQQILSMNRFDYVNFTSEYYADFLGKKTYFLPNEKIIEFGYPRCDLLFDSDYVDSAYKDKKVALSVDCSIDKEDKIILYTPTWRPYKYNFPLSEMPGFSFVDFNEWLRLNNFVFFYTIHPNLLPENMPNNLDKIIFIDSKTNPMFDINQFMPEVDILINDYSTTSTDFSILGRPQIFYMPDYQFYNNEKCFIEPYKDILPGEEVIDYESLTSALLSAKKSPSFYVDRFQAETKELQEKYYNTSYNNATVDICEFVLRFLPDR